MNITAVGRLSDASVIARLDVRVKFALLILSSTLIFVWNSLPLQASLLAVLVVVSRLAGLTFVSLFALFRTVLPGLIVIIIIQGLWSPFGVSAVFVIPDHAPFLAGRTIFTVEGLLFGLVVACRILVPTLAFNLIFETTSPNDIVFGLVRCRVPYRIAFLFTTTFRFVPLLMQEFQTMRDAQRLRGIDIDRVGPIAKLVAWARMLVPLLIAQLGKASKLEIALQARAFTGSSRRTSLYPSRTKLSPVELAVIAFLSLVFICATTMRLWLGIGGNIL